MSEVVSGGKICVSEELGVKGSFRGMKNGARYSHTEGGWRVAKRGKSKESYL